MAVRPALPRRAGRRTNLALLGLLLLAFVTGVLAYGVGTPTAATVVVAIHGAAGLGLLLLVPWKAVIVRRSWASAARTRTLATGLGVGVAITVLTGVLHAIGVAPLWMLLLHVAIAVCVVPLLLVHAWGRGQRPRRTDLSRRTLLKAGVLAAGAASLWATTEGALRLTGAPGADRRGTGSLEHGTDDPTAMPITQWFTDTVPERIGDAITVVRGDRQARVPIRELDRGDRVRAVLDCTGGWYAAQDWAGVRLDRLLDEIGVDLPGGGSVDVISRTGYRRRLPLHDASSLLLATSAAGRALSDGHGAPVRLIAPGRRGFWWVKWVERIEVVDAPWWRQPPFPLQ
ncbi:MAG TPA: molybdopterin-dependent oxidoreductase [Blastococcus sp.]|nr:molybdopterin-dependent oxidoreductase [Blastococcus sp.]